MFLYKHVLGQSVGELEDVVRAKRRRRIPVVLTRDEVREILRHVKGVPWIVLTLLYGTGMRLMECLRLRVQDIDFGQNEITIRDGKGGKDRRTILPGVVKPALETHLATVKKVHERDLAEGFGRVELPGALARKYPAADKQWRWQYAFPSAKRSNDRRSGVVRRFDMSHRLRRYPEMTPGCSPKLTHPGRAAFGGDDENLARGKTLALGQAVERPPIRPPSAGMMVFYRQSYSDRAFGADLAPLSRGPL